MAYSFYIDEIYNDFRISNGDLVLVQGADNVVQQIRITLKTELGEWFLNTNFGLPYYSSTKNINDNSTPGIQVESFDFQGIGTQSEVNISLGVGNDG